MPSALSTPNHTLTVRLYKAALWLLSRMVELVLPNSPFGRMTAVRCAATTALCGLRQIKPEALEVPNIAEQFLDLSRILTFRPAHRSHMLQQLAETVRSHAGEQAGMLRLSGAQHPDTIATALERTQGPAVIFLKSVGTDDKIHFPWAQRDAAGNVKLFRCCRKSQEIILRDAVMVYRR